MSSNTKKPSTAPRELPHMNSSEFVAAVKLFYPVLDAIITPMVVKKTDVRIIEYEGYGINGFDKNFTSSRKVKARVTIGNSSPIDMFVEILYIKSSYSDSKYHKPYQVLVYLDFLKHLSENKAQHEFWFL